MSRLRQTGKSTTANTVRGSRMTGTGYGMGRHPENPPTRSPMIPIKYSTPDKKRLSLKKFGTGKKQT